MSDIVVLEKLPVGAGNVISGIGDYKRRKIYIFATRPGIFFLLLLLLMLVLAVNYSNSMAYVMTFLLGSLLMVSMLHTNRNLRGLVISSLAASPVFAGEHIKFPLLLDNRTGQKRVAITIESYAENRRRKRKKKNPDPEVFLEPLTISLQPGKVARNDLLIRTGKRGYLKPGRIKIESCYPLGLFRAWSYIESERVCIVYPRPAGSPQLPVFTEYESEQQMGKKTGTDDFTGFKPYRHGDSIRNIDWKAFAKQQPLQVKRFSGSGANKLILSWNHCSYIKDIELRLSQLCLWVLNAEQEGFLYGLEIPGELIELGNGDVHMQKCLTALACFGLKE